MKRIITLLLTVAMCIALCACGGNGGMSKEKMLEIAQELDIADISTTFSQNEARAKETYVGNTYTVSGYIENITSDYCVIEKKGPSTTNYELRVYLSKDDLVKVNTGEKILVVGEITALESIIEYPIAEQFAEMKNAYLIDNNFEITGVITQFDSYGGSRYCVIRTDDYDSPIGVFLDENTLNGLSIGNTITVAGIITYDGFSSPYYRMKDVELIN